MDPSLAERLPRVVAERYACPVVFWLPEYAATLLAKHAPDFWRYRSHRFEFVSEQAGIVEGLTDRFAGDFSMAANLSAEEKRFRIAELEQRIAEAGDPPPKELARHVSVWLSELGFLYDFVGGSEKAERMVREALEIHERTGVRRDGARQSGGCLLEARRIGPAEEMHRRSLEVAAGLGWRQAMAGNYDSLGIISVNAGDLKRPRKCIAKHLRSKREPGSSEGNGRRLRQPREHLLSRRREPGRGNVLQIAGNRREDWAWLEGIARGHNGLGHVYAHARRLDACRGDVPQVARNQRKAWAVRGNGVAMAISV